MKHPPNEKGLPEASSAPSLATNAERSSTEETRSLFSRFLGRNGSHCEKCNAPEPRHRFADVRLCFLCAAACPSTPQAFADWLREGETGEEAALAVFKRGTPPKTEAEGVITALGLMWQVIRRGDRVRGGHK